MKALDFSNRNVFVIGGSSGIGNGIAQGFLTHGANVFVAGTRSSAAEYDDVPGSNLSGLVYSQLDISRPDDIVAFNEPFPSLDVLVLSQGFVVFQRGEFERSGWNRVMQINLHSLMDCARRFRGMLLQSKGSLVIVSSVSAFMANRGNPAYAASKAAAVSLVKTLGEAWAADGIRVNGIAPGYVETKLTAVTLGNPKRRAAALAHIPAQRLGTPEDMAGAVLFLASPLASYIIGQTIIVDGGAFLS